MSDKNKPYDPKHKRAWTAYKFWEDADKRVQAWSNRKRAVEDGRSNMDLALILSAESAFKVLLKETAKPELLAAGRDFGPIFEWATSIRGIADWLAVKFLAPIDDIGRFATISKLWRFCGLACIDGEAEPKDSEHYVRHLKATFLGPRQVANQFVRHHTFPYRDLYDEYKNDQRGEYPEPVCAECGALSPEKMGKVGSRKSACCNATINFTDSHLDKRACRIIAKEFIKHLWLVWRQIEGLPITEPHPEDEVILPPNWPMKVM